MTSRIPNFAEIPLAGESLAIAAPALGEPWMTPEGIPVKGRYGPEDREGLEFLDTYPGIAPFLRGPYPTMYVTQPWTIRQYAGFSTAEDLERLLPPQPRGRAEGPVGRLRSRHPPRLRFRPSRASRAMSAWRAWRSTRSTTCGTLFSGIPLDEMTVSMTMNGAVLPILALYIVAAEEQGVPPQKLAGTIQNDILKGVHGPQHLHLSPKGSMRIISDIFAYTSKNMPKFNSISISGYHMQEAGATNDLELAYTLADGVEYIKAGLAAGLTIDQFAPRLSFFWAISTNFFMEVAKMRAARLIWAKLVKEFRSEIGEVAGPAHPLADLGLVAHRPGRVQQRHPHQHRGDGGDAGRTQSLHTNALDEALALPTDFSARIARNTQLFLQQESGTTPDRRSLGRLLLRGEAHRRHGRPGLGAHPRGRRARRHGQGDRGRHPEAADRGGRAPAPRRGSIPGARPSWA
ncbi:methylmalonyl-CoA mutase family protein [Methylobacterium oryzae CBMB20]